MRLEYEQISLRRLDFIVGAILAEFLVWTYLAADRRTLAAARKILGATQRVRQLIARRGTRHLACGMRTMRSTSLFGAGCARLIALLVARRMRASDIACCFAGRAWIVSMARRAAAMLASRVATIASPRAFGMVRVTVLPFSSRMLQSRHCFLQV